jgi:hypothetical protein
MLFEPSNVFTCAPIDAVQLAPLSFDHSSVTVVGWKPVQVRFQRNPIASRRSAR